MTISLTPKLEALIDEKVRSGRYASASDVVHEALCLLEERDRDYETRRAALIADIEAGMNSGPSIDGDEAFRQIRSHMAAFPNGKPPAR